MINDRPNKCLEIGTWGAVITAICCFTPMLVLGLGVIGLGMLTPYLDYVLMPAFSLFLGVAVFGLWQKKRVK